MKTQFARIEYADFDNHLNSTMSDVVVGQSSFKPSEVLWKLDRTSYTDMFIAWSDEQFEQCVTKPLGG